MTKVKYEEAQARVHNRIAMVKRERGISNKDLADVSGASLSTVNRWMAHTNDFAPDTRQFSKICCHYGLSPNWLLLGIGKMMLSDAEPLFDGNADMGLYAANRDKMLAMGRWLDALKIRIDGLANAAE